MNGPDDEAEVKPSLLSAFDLSSLKALGTFLGIIGSGGGGFAALSFGIGYLAIKKQDELIGLPTTVSDPTSYIRTGALFFSNSAYFILDATYKFLILVSLIGLFIVLIFVATKKFGLFRSLRARKAADLASPPAPGWFLPTAFTLLLALALCTLSLQTAVSDPQNRNLLYQVISDRQAKLAPMHGSAPIPVLPPKVENVIDWPPWQQSLAGRINTLLRHPQGRHALQLFYGQQFALVLVVLYGVVVCRLKRKQWSAKMEQLRNTSPEWKPYRVAQSLAPFVYLVALALVINLPTVYGVLCLPTSAALVRVSVTGPEGQKETTSGTLLSDLSSGGKEIWLLSESQSKFLLTVLDRSNVSDIALLGEVTDNFLAIEDPK